jgi:ketosteroid isomerase-like protein
VPNLPTPVAQVMESYVTAVAAKDAKALTRLYDPSVRIFDAWDRWVYEGAAAWQSNLDHWLGSLGDSSVRVSFEETHTFGSHPLWVMNAIITFAAVSAAGEVSHSMQNRLTWAIRLSDAGARIIHEHTSAPIGIADMQAILTR